jgi:hypothetical protein
VSTLEAMSDDILYQRLMAHGPAIRIRRTSVQGSTPVVAVLEVDRRAGTPRGGIGTLPPLAEAQAGTEAEAVAILEAHARDDRAIVQLLHQKGLR